MFALFAGVGAGLPHVFWGPDHLAAVAPLAADTDRTHWCAGLQWGIGHTFAAGIGLLSTGIGGNHHRRNNGLLYASSAAALVIGGFWLAGR